MSAEWTGGRGWRLAGDRRTAHVEHRWGGIHGGMWHLEVEFQCAVTGEWQVWDRALLKGREKAFRQGEEYVLGSSAPPPRGSRKPMERWVAERNCHLSRARDARPLYCPPAPQNSKGGDPIV